MFQKCLFFREGHIYGEAAFLRKVPGDSFQAEGLDFAHHGRHQVVAEAYLPAAGGGFLYYLRLLQGIGRGRFVGPDETGHAEQDAAEVAHYHHQHVLQALGIYLPEDGPSGRSGGLAVVTASGQFRPRTDTKGRTIVVATKLYIR